MLELKAGVWRIWYVFAASPSATGGVVQLTLERQWASKGRPVNLIDAQEKQLSDGVKYIDGLRGSSSPQLGAQWGEVKTFNSDSLQAAIQDAFARKDYAAMREACSDRMVESIAIVGNADEVAQRMTDRARDANSITPVVPHYELSTDKVAEYSRRIADLFYR